MIHCSDNVSSGEVNANFLSPNGQIYKVAGNSPVDFAVNPSPMDPLATRLVWSKLPVYNTEYIDRAYFDYFQLLWQVDFINLMRPMLIYLFSGHTQLEVKYINPLANSRSIMIFL